MSILDIVLQTLKYKYFKKKSAQHNHIDIEIMIIRMELENYKKFKNFLRKTLKERNHESRH